MRENLIRLCCVLFGVALTLWVMLIGDHIYDGENDFKVALEMEEIPMEVEAAGLEEGKIYDGYEPEMIAQLQLPEKNDTISGNDTEKITDNSVNNIVASSVKWVKDYPKVSSDMTLEEKLQERSSYEETLTVNAFDKSVIENSTIDFSDVKITILGDSLTTGVNLEEEERAQYMYPTILQQILGCKEIVNLGIGGSSVSRAGNYSMVDRYKEIPKDSDIIIVFGSSNDCLFENKQQYGNVEYDKRKNSGTFCGDLDELCAGIAYEYGISNEGNYCKLLYINPPSTILNDGVYASDPENMVLQGAFADAINTIAPEYGFEVIDLYNNNILNSHDQEVNAQFVPDGIHMSPEGYRILAEHIASQIIQRIES